MLTRDEHRREAERLLSAASWQRSPADPYLPPGMDPQAVALMVARAQVHATLAAKSDGNPADGNPILDDLMHAVACWVCAELTSPDDTTRDRAAALCDELDREKFEMSALVARISVSRGNGPFHFTVADRVYDLRHQYEDRNGVVWEHTGRWAQMLGSVVPVPVMVTPDQEPPLRQMPLTELVEQLWPLMSRKVSAPSQVSA